METNEKYKRQPFMSVPVAEAYFPASSIEQARLSVFRCLNRGEGIAVVFGSNGLGKTLLLRVLAEDFQRNDLVVLAHSCPRSIKAFYQQLLLGFHQTWCGCDENECRLFTIDYLQKNIGQKVVLLIDEAQRLSLPVFEELRILLDLCDNDQVRFCVALASSPRLEERLTLPRLSAFCQRIVCRAWLDPFTWTDTGNYIDNALTQAGPLMQKIQFENEAKRLIHSLSEGVPRVINQICDAVVYSLLNGRKSQNACLGQEDTTDRHEDLIVREKDVVQSWALLQQVSPDSVPRSTKSALVSNGNLVLPQTDSSQEVVEFGSLDEDEDLSEAMQTDEACEDRCDTDLSGDSLGEDQIDGHIGQGLDMPSELCEERIVPVADADLKYDRMICERLLGDTLDTSCDPSINDAAHLPVPNDQEQSFRPDEEEFSEICLTDTPSVDESSDHSGATFEVDFSESQTEYRCDKAHFHEDDDTEASSDEYLEELLSLEGEVSLEAEVIHQIRDIGQRLDRARRPADRTGETGRNSLAHLDFSEESSDARAESKRRLAQTASVLTAKQEEVREKQFRHVFQQAYTKEKGE